MSKDKEEKEDISHALVCCVNTVCVVLLFGITICVDTYIKAVYDLEEVKVQNLRHPYYSV